jgi:hypothetical protein
MLLCALRGQGVNPFEPHHESEVLKMAIYHCSISNVSRAKGSSACASLAYITASKVYEERTQQTYAYGRAERVEKVATLLPDGAPSEYANAARLFNSIENYEKAANARTAKKIEVALPRELNLGKQIEIVENYIRENLTKEGYCATYAIHSDKDNTNPHAHILVANRQLNKKGEWSSKRKMEYALDEQGERIPRLDENGKQKTDKNGRKQWVRVSAEQNPLDKQQFLEQLRKGWADECNKHLSAAHQIDPRSNASRGIDDTPTIHEGYAARAMEARGKLSERMEINREIRRKNDLLHQFIAALKTPASGLLNQIYTFAKKWLTHTAEHEVVTAPMPAPTPKTQPALPPVTPPDEPPVVKQAQPMPSLDECDDIDINSEVDAFTAYLDDVNDRAARENTSHTRSRSTAKSRDINR